MKCAIGWHQNHTYHVHSFWDIPDLNVVHFSGTPTSSTWHRERHGQVTESGGGVNKSPWIWLSFDVCLSRLRRNAWKLWAKQMWYIFLRHPVVRLIAQTFRNFHYHNTYTFRDHSEQGKTKYTTWRWKESLIIVQPKKWPTSPWHPPCRWSGRRWFAPWQTASARVFQAQQWCRYSRHRRHPCLSIKKDRLWLIGDTKSLQKCSIVCGRVPSRETTLGAMC